MTKDNRSPEEIANEIIFYSRDPLMHEEDGAGSFTVSELREHIAAAIREARAPRVFSNAEIQHWYDVWIEDCLILGHMVNIQFAWRNAWEKAASLNAIAAMEAEPLKRLGGGV